MPLKFIHLSDIHFGQETGSDVYFHNDVKECLIADAANLAASDAETGFAGVIVTGDVAFSGKAKEYQEAGEWLDKLTVAIGCGRENVMVVPGNHDIDRDAISPGGKLMLRQIVAGGDKALNEFLDSEVDREVLYGRFSNYRVFADAYSCPLDGEGRFASARKLAIAPGRFLRFIGLNSALVCSNEDVEGKLLLGVRQHLLPRNPGEELVVLCHHPLDWSQDSKDATRYVRSRARVLICGHIHSPSLRVEPTPDDADLVTLSAGATVPPDSEDEYAFSYNIIYFDWDAKTDGLKITVVPRLWDYENTRFDDDTTHFNESELSVVLRCSNFQAKMAPSKNVDERLSATTVETVADGGVAATLTGGEAMDNSSRLLQLRFFRDLTTTQRVGVFIELGILPEGWNEGLTHNIEHQLLYAVLKSGRQRDVEGAIEAAERDRGAKDGDEI